MNLSEISTKKYSSYLKKVRTESTEEQLSKSIILSITEKITAECDSFIIISGTVYKLVYHRYSKLKNSYTKEGIVAIKYNELSKAVSKYKTKEVPKGLYHSNIRASLYAHAYANQHFHII